MTAGASAQYEAQRSLLEADEYERLRDAARRRAANYEAAARSEAAVGGALHALTELGWTVLADRRWGRRSNIDFLLVGDAGIVVVDVKNWRDLQVRGSSIFREDECCDDEIDKNLDLARQVAETVEELGVAPSAVLPTLVFFTRSGLEHSVRGVDLLGEHDLAAWLTRRPRRFNAHQARVVAEALATAYPSYSTPLEPAPPAVRRARVVPPRRVEEQPALIDTEALTDALVEQALAGPIEEWMTFLHPTQLKLVSARHRGPARVRGAAGTGKTVVGLHRAAHLARGNRQTVFFVTFVRTLPVVLRSLATRLAPNDVDRLDFSGLHQLARRVLIEAGVGVHVDTARVGTAFAKAWVHVGRGSALAALDERPAYWKEEIDYVIKGRGIEDFDDYASLSRTGRRTRMTRAHREVMWDLYAAYAAELRTRDLHDFNDLLILARDLVRDGTVDLDCGGVVVDEVQDLTMVGLQLLHALAGDGEDRFLIIGDGQQSVYPGGFALAEAGIDVRGRATVLEVNYRNTAEILDAARRVIGGDSFEDLDDTSEAGERAVAVRRRGEAPTTASYATRSALDMATVERLQTLVDAGVRSGDIAVLSLDRRGAEHAAAVVRRAGLEVVDLLEYDGVTSDGVKVGTVKRAKGLEFAHVLLPGLESDVPRPWPGECDEAYDERVARHRREVFVAMTRARDGLWVGHLE